VGVLVNSYIFLVIIFITKSLDKKRLFVYISNLGYATHIHIKIYFFLEKRMSKQTFYVTTPIYYGTARPHLGSLYSTLIADVINRWEQLKGKDTYFLTGTDEHGQKIAQAARQAGMPPKKFVDSFIAAYKETWNTYDIGYSQFIRTTDPYHIKGVQELITKLMDKGDIYKATYQGWYCTPCETYVTAAELDQSMGPKCPSCGRDTVAISEESYFFKLSAYQDKLIDFYKKNPDFITPQKRFNEVTSFVQAGLKDVSISRTTISWGVPFPKDPDHVVYVWIDALCNYITAIGYGDPERSAELVKWWPADVQVLGKDIIRFHAVYWPAMLMAVNLQPPRRLLVHGWIQVNKQKMSKSRGNVVDPMDLAKTYGAEPVRYYLLRHIPTNDDGDFSLQDLEKTINADLANDLGNLLNRMSSLAHKNDLFEVQPPKNWDDKSLALQAEIDATVKDIEQYFNDYEFHLALARIWKLIKATNAYFHEQEPWKVALKDKKLFVEIISATCHSLYAIAILLWPILPKKMEELLAAIGQKFHKKELPFHTQKFDIWNQLFQLKKIDPLFEKIEELPKENAVEKQEKKAVHYITIDDLKKVELRVGTIVAAEAIVGSDKLVKMQVDLGPLGKRQILAGIRASYSPEELLNKQGLFVCNLQPRKMMGTESQGMMLVAHDDQGKVQLMAPNKIVPNGTLLQ
jgi:methionyl-tRNA synthetase